MPIAADRFLSPLSVLFALCLVLPACGSGPEFGPPGPPGGDGGEGEGEGEGEGDGGGDGDAGGDADADTDADGDGDGDRDAGGPEDGARVLQLRSGAYALASGTEEYHCFWIAPEQDDAAAVAFEPIGGQGVHHVVVFRDNSGWHDDRRCEALEGDWTMLAGAGVGSGTVRFPEGVAMPIGAGDVFVIQIHMLNTTEDTITIDGGYDLTLTAPGAQYTRAGLYTITTTDISIPPGAEDHTVETSCSGQLPDGAQLFNIFPHMHQLGRRFESAILSDAGDQAVYTGGWNFESQVVEPLDPILTLGQDDALWIRCTYDNPTDSTVSFGLSTYDEMCGSAFYYYPATQDEIRCLD